MSSVIVLVFDHYIPFLLAISNLPENDQPREVAIILPLEGCGLDLLVQTGVAKPLTYVEKEQEGDDLPPWLFDCGSFNGTCALPHFLIFQHLQLQFKTCLLYGQLNVNLRNSPKIRIPFL